MSDKETPFSRNPKVPPQPAERSDKDYAIEHAEYLAKAVEHYQHKKNSFSKFMETADTDRDEEYIDQLRSELSGAWMGMTAGIYEFRKRAKRAAATPQVTPELAEKILDILDELTPEDAECTHPAAIAYQRVALLLDDEIPEGTPEQAPPELELEQEADGRWLAEYTRFPGVMAYGPTKEEAIRNAAKVLIESEQATPRLAYLSKLPVDTSEASEQASPTPEKCLICGSADKTRFLTPYCPSPWHSSAATQKGNHSWPVAAFLLEIAPLILIPVLIWACGAYLVLHFGKFW